MGCQKQPTEKGDDAQAIFPKGELGPAKNFTGKAWAFGLVKSDTTYHTLIGNVYFEPGARSNRFGGPMAYPPGWSNPDYNGRYGVPSAKRSAPANDQKG